MKNVLLLVLLSLILNSCATILNNSFITVDIYTTEPASIIFEQDTLVTENNKASLYLERRNERVSFTAQTDSISKTISLKSRLSPAIALNAFWITGLFIDQGKDKVYEYPSSIQLDMSNDIPEFYLYGIPDAKKVYFNFKIPYLNSYFVNPYEWIPRESGVGYLGLGLGLEYYYKKNRFINFSYSFIGSISFDEVPRNGENFYSFSGHLTHNHRFRRWSYGYGLSYSDNYWQNNVFTTDAMGVPRSTFLYRDTKNLGLVVNGYLQVTQRFYLGIIYRPTLVQLQPNFQTQYEHLMSLEFLWKFRTRD